jgi:hypothetical protein
VYKKLVKLEDDMRGVDVAGRARASLARRLMIGVLLVLFVAAGSEAATWYVKADPSHSGDGSKNRPFCTLQEAEAASLPGDTILIIQSKGRLDGGIQLKDGQALIGLGPSVTGANPHSARAMITNTSGLRYDGDAIRLARNNLVQNIHIDNAFRSSILGINAVGAQIRDNLMTNDMAVHDIFAIEGPAPSKCGANTPTPPAFICVGEWPNGYILFAPQTNHFGAITLVSCGSGSRSTVTNGDVRVQGYCKFLDPSASSVANTGQVVIDGNVIRDSNSDGIMLINDLGIVGNFTVNDNVVKDLSQRLPDPVAVGITDHVIRSRGFTIITIENSVTNLTLSKYVGSNLSPFGNFAADGVVFLTSGLNPVSNNTLSDIAISNPFLSGDTSNGDSIEIQHRGSTNAVLNVDITRADLRDPASTNVKLIESSNPDNGTYNVTLTDSVLSNINTHGTEDTQIRYNGTERSATKAINLTLRNVKISGLGRGIGLTVPATVAAPPVMNTNNIKSLKILVENSSLSDLTREAVYWSQAFNRAIGTVGGAIIDLGGGPLGSRGNNRFVNNGVPGFVPPGADPSGIEPITFDGDLSIANANPNQPSIDVYASNDFWGGGAPIRSTTPGETTDVHIPAGSNVTFTSTSFLATDPEP